MEYLKFKLASIRHQKPSRFGNYDLSGDLSDHQLIGILPNERDFQLGTPNLSRNENITLVLSNGTSKDTILLQMKWRVIENTVVLTSKLNAVLNDDIYKFEQTEVYEPSKSSVWPDYITQFGSQGSCLKLFIVSPYRRLRLVFRGYMHQIASDEKPPVEKFMKLNFVINSTAAIFDFLRQYDAECFKLLYKQLKPTLSIEQTISDLLLHDRHEQPCRALGDYTIFESDNTKCRKEIILWGFYIKQYLENNNNNQVGSKRILAHLMNGQLFHIGNRSINDKDKMEFGYTCFEVRIGMCPIEKPFFVNWEKVQEGEEFELEVSGESRTFDCKLKRRVSGLDHFYDIEMNDKTGFAWVESTSGDEIPSSEEELNKELVDEYRKSIEEGKVVAPVASPDAEISNEEVLVSVKDLSCCSSTLVGSKASSLALLDKFSHQLATSEGEATVGGYIVPHAFVLTRFAHDKIFECENPNLDDETKKLVELISEGKLENLRQECERIEKLISQTPLPESIRLDLTKKLEEHYGSEKLESLSFAVRSSSWGEDEDDMSAAGQLSTLLGVRGLDSIMKAVMSCFASKYTFANVEYKRQHGLSPNLPMAVVIQEMVECDKAGVLFTCEPTTGNNRLLTITANYGLGESVVSGQSEPDSIQVRFTPSSEHNISKDLFEIEKVQVGEKKIIITSEGSSGEGYDKTKCCLSDDEILRLSKWAKSLVSYFRCERDIEWGFKGDQLYLFQSRPITGLESYTERELIHETDQTSRAELDFMTRVNIGEVMPYPVKPLTLTYSTRLWTVFAALFLQKLQPNDILNRFWPEVANDEVLFYAYNLFFNMRCSMMFQSCATEKNIMIRAMEVAFFGHEVGEQPELMEASKGLKTPRNLFQGPRFEAYALGLKLWPLSVIMREKRRMAQAREDVRNLKFAKGYESNKMLGLLKQLRCLNEIVQEAWQNHITVIMITNSNNASLSMLLAKYIKDPVELFTAQAKILANSPDVISAEIPKRIASMAQHIIDQGSEEVDRFLKLTDHQELLKYVETNEKVNGEFNAFIERFGHRNYNEFELAEKSWRENPALIVEMIQLNCKSNSSSHRENSNCGEKKQIMSIDQIVESLNLDLTFKDRALLKYSIIPRCQNLVACRERTKDILVEHTDIVREASRMLAQEMRKNLRIPDDDLFYYLIYHELEPLIREAQPSIIVQATRRRNMFKKVMKEPWLFDEIIEGPEIVPKHMQPNKELDETLANAQKLYGTPASCGKVQAKVCLVSGYNELDKVQAGDILLTHSTDIGFSPIFPLLSGIITEVGGLISHGAVVAREYGLPSVLGIPEVTRILKDGEEIILDADNGEIVRLNP